MSFLFHAGGKSHLSQQRALDNPLEVLKSQNKIEFFVAKKQLVGVRPVYFFVNYHLFATSELY
jgi:hypothetical protein